MLNGAAKGDPRRFEDLDTFDPDRRTARYQYLPTYSLRGLTRLHIEFDVR